MPEGDASQEQSASAGAQVVAGGQRQHSPGQSSSLSEAGMTGCCLWITLRNRTCTSCHFLGKDRIVRKENPRLS